VKKCHVTLPEPGIQQDDSGRTILIAEDNQEMRSYLVNELSVEYEILEAENGEEGLEKCLKFNPDLIMSDIMMPGTDGFEFCKQVKSDERTSHIPVLLVTALSGSESQTGRLPFRR
jgi:CheY-like chemotaxis protein